MKTVYLILIGILLSSCGMISSYITKQPPVLTVYPTPKMIPVPVTKFAWLDDRKDFLVVEPSVIDDIGHNTAKCLNVLDAYAEQISAYNRIYAPKPEE